MTRLPAPELEEEQGTLRSTSFGDIYYSPDDGLAETEHVFLNGNELHRRLREHPEDKPFVIGELGFGTGLNLLAVCQAASDARSGPIHFWTLEGFPLSPSDFANVQKRIAERWPALTPWAERLAETYPDPVPGQIQIPIDQRVTLTLAFGEALPSLQAASFQAEAWFLDGFAPSKNPAMWSAEVMSEVARLTKRGGTAATFSVASGVRTALETAGFAWEKTPGFGRKKQMLRARLEHRRLTEQAKPWFSEPSALRPGPIAVIGTGIAGASVANALSRLGREVTLFGRSGKDEAASSNQAGLIMPRLDADDTPIARFYRDAFRYAVATYTDLAGDAFHACGGSLTIEGEKFSKITEHGLWPDHSLTFGNGRVVVSDAGVLDPRRACDALIAGKAIIDGKVEDIQHTEDGWMILTADAETAHGPFAGVVLATGAWQPLWKEAPITPSLGQIDLFDGQPPDHIITDGHYVAPYGEGVVAGATYAPFEGGTPAPTEANTAANREAATTLLGRDAGQHLQSRAALRATTPDRHPMAGPLYDQNAALNGYAGLNTGLKSDYPRAPYQPGLYALTGLGSRGLVTAPILGAHIAAVITGGVSPLTKDQSDLVHPGRFLIRDLRRRKVSPQ